MNRGGGEIFAIGTGKKTPVNQIYRAPADASGLELPITPSAPNR